MTKEVGQLNCGSPLGFQSYNGKKQSHAVRAEQAAKKAHKKGLGSDPLIVDHICEDTLMRRGFMTTGSRSATDRELPGRWRSGHVVLPFYGDEPHTGLLTARDDEEEDLEDEEEEDDDEEEEEEDLEEEGEEEFDDEFDEDFDDDEDFEDLDEDEDFEEFDEEDFDEDEDDEEDEDEDEEEEEEEDEE
ncbi:MAG: hypothetical protein AB7K24_02985 [Gemmataceae bacterium]